MKTISLSYLYLTVFTSGLVVLAIEMLASRLLGPVFGASNLVWANVIGLILVYLTLGYFIGGRWADRFPVPPVFYQLVAWGALATGSVPLAVRPVLQFAARLVAPLDAAVLAGSFVAVWLLFSVPMILLGCVSPFAMRLALDDTRSVGQVSGRMYAISTLGSLVGTFVPTLLLVPFIGTLRAFLLCAWLLLGVALVGLWRVDRRRALWSLWMPFVLGLLAVGALWGNL